MNPEPILAATGLRKSYRSGDRVIEVLRGAAIAVAPGQSVSIRGESGSGKTTLLNLLAGLDAAEGGEIRWAGAAVTGLGNNALAERRARFLGMVFQAYYLIPEIDARANVLMAGRILGRVGPGERGRARELLVRVGLAERAPHLPAQLSGGECQRVAIARALMNRPRVILADEPTGNLDERTGDAVIDVLLGACAEQGAALVLVTHNPRHAARCGQRLLLHDGVLREV
ncbi:MAG TPA: ABC transporter ATP-binding protein [Opitutaceae bacterium]|nr:ABC transporter ATP-binding protein [Opitutaceae bacterium]